MLIYLIVCPLVFLGGFVDAIAGGGGLITLPAYMLAGIPVHHAIATNKMSSCMGTSIATARYALSGFVPWKQVPFYIACAFLGSVMGANLSLRLDTHTFKILMLIFLPLLLVYLTRTRNLDRERTPLPLWRTIVTGMVIALVIGVYDGFYGPGTGSFLILFLTVFAHMDLKTANGTTKVINLSTNVSALVVFFLNGVVLWKLGLVAGMFNVAGNYLGASCFTKKSNSFVRPVMISVLCIFLVKLILELLNIV